MDQWNQTVPGLENSLGPLSELPSCSCCLRGSPDPVCRQTDSCLPSLGGDPGEALSTRGSLTLVVRLLLGQCREEPLLAVRKKNLSVLKNNKMCWETRDDSKGCAVQTYRGMQLNRSESSSWPSVVHTRRSKPSESSPL